MNKTSVKKRLMRKTVKRNGCWEWDGYRTPDGYGMIRVDDAMKLTHRVSYKIHVGEIPEGLSVLHRCDNPRCIRPSHLRVGTQADNVEDMISKNRLARGEKKAGAKLNWLKVAEIRKRLTENNESLGKEFGVSPRTIRSVKLNEKWKL